jgi:hypothetical protein
MAIELTTERRTLLDARPMQGILCRLCRAGLEMFAVMFRQVQGPIPALAALHLMRVLALYEALCI